MTLLFLRVQLGHDLSVIFLSTMNDMKRRKETHFANNKLLSKKSVPFYDMCLM